MYCAGFQDARFQTHAHLSLMEVQSILKDRDDCCQSKRLFAWPTFSFPTRNEFSYGWNNANRANTHDRRQAPYIKRLAFEHWTFDNTPEVGPKMLLREWYWNGEYFNIVAISLELRRRHCRLFKLKFYFFVVKLKNPPLSVSDLQLLKLKIISLS